MVRGLIPWDRLYTGRYFMSAYLLRFSLTNCRLIPSIRSVQDQSRHMKKHHNSFIVPSNIPIHENIIEFIRKNLTVVKGNGIDPGLFSISQPQKKIVQICSLLLSFSSVFLLQLRNISFRPNLNSILFLVYVNYIY